MGLRAFFGILPPRLPHSKQAADQGVAPVPREVVLLADGADPAGLAVRPGDSVKTGQNLAAEGQAPLVATATGRVSRVDCVTGAEGGERAAVVIVVTGEDEFAADLSPIEDLEAATPDDLRQALLRAGLPGLAALQDRARIGTVIASALDEAPGCAINGGFLRNGATADLGAALRCWQRAAGAERIVLALPQGAALPPGLPADVTVVKTPAVYPHGLPEMLALRQGGWLYQRTPAGPLGDTLVVDLDVLLAGFRCLREGRPFFERTVSCLGPGEREPRNVTVRIGAPAAEVLAHLGLEPEAGGKLLLTSPLRGSASPDSSRPILPQTRQLVLQAAAQVHHFQSMACTSCGGCDAICPVDLEVSMLARYAEYDRFDRCADLAVERCIDCGLCAYVCPAHRPVAHLMIHAKQTLWRSPERRQEPIDTAGCNACGPSCPAIRLFDLSPEPDVGDQEKRS